jgi:hypothetical protein
MALDALAAFTLFPCREFAHSRYTICTRRAHDVDFVHSDSSAAAADPPDYGFESIRIDNAAR